MESKTNNDRDNNKRPALDERYLLARLNNKNDNTNFKELSTIITNLESKYDDEELEKKDQELNDLIIGGLNKIQTNSEQLDIDKFMHVDKLMSLRFRNIKAPPKKYSKNEIPPIILNNMHEIEKIYTLYYLHPCYFRDFFGKSNNSNINSSNFKHFMNGIKPLFTDIHQYSKKSESLSNIVYLTIFNQLIEPDAENYNSKIDELYIKQVSFVEVIIESYFYNQFNRSVLLDVFDKSLRDLYAHCKSTVYNYTSTQTNLSNVGKIKEIFKELRNMFADPSHLATSKVRIKI